MGDSFPVAAIVSLLAETWKLRQTDDFRDYLIQVRGQCVVAKPPFDRIMIYQSTEGEFEHGGLQGCSQWWQVDDQGIISVGGQPIVDKWFNPNKTIGDFYLTPMINFFSTGGKILIGECYGPEFVSRKAGKLVWQADRLILTEVKFIWTFASL